MTIPAYIVRKYIGLANIDGLVEHGDGYLGRCPLCGDSKKNKKKKRFYILNKNDNFSCYCHNCNTGISFYKFIREYRPHLFDSFKQEITEASIGIKKKDDAELFMPKKKAKVFIQHNGLLDELQPVKTNRMCLQYCFDRKLPIDFVRGCFYHENFLEWGRQHNLTDTEYKRYKDERLIIPFYNAEGKLTHLQGRALDKTDKQRYLTLAVEPDALKVWGMNKVDCTKNVYIFEGALDAVFIPNSIAMGGAYMKFPEGVTKKNAVYVFDDDIKTNQQLRETVKRIISDGIQICLFPETFKYKDINDAIVDGMSAKEIEKIIKANILSGDRAFVQLEGLTYAKRLEKLSRYF